MHYICTANKGVKFILKWDLYCGSPFTALHIYIYTYIYELSFFLPCDAKDMFNALMLFFVLEDK